MYFLHKRHLVGLLLLIYSLSYFLQSWFFVDLGSVFAESSLNRTHLVAVFVDKDIYQNAKDDIEWYATDYIQQRISNSKALVLPINTKNFKAIDLVRMLENMYFDGVKGETSDLLGAVFIGNIPLPVVQNNGFIYPTIFPYVDFEDQEFIYDANQQFFVYNNNPRGQAEIWHGVLNFGSTISQYHEFFQKLRSYAKAPTDFVSPLLWYDDFVGMKNTFSQETLPFYINDAIFSEDVGYHRFTNLMLDYFKRVQNDGMSDLTQGLQKISTDNPELSAVMQEGNGSFDALGQSSVPTTMLLSVIKELFAKYETLYPGVFLSTIKDNTQAAARWYKQTNSGQWVDGVDSHIHKLALKDSLVLGDASKGISSVVISFNDIMEKALDQEIEDNRWYMTLPIITQYSHEDRQKKKKLTKRWCQKITNDVYKNYYFGTYAQDIISAEQFSIYRGTYRNLSTFSGISILNSGYDSSNTKSLGASNNLFATQVEGNRGYDLMSAASDYDTYSGNKIKEKRTISCSKWFKILGIKLYCMTRKGKYVGDTYESIEDFGIRGWGGASSLLLDSGALSQNPPKYVLNKYNYKSALFPIYDIGGSVAVATGKADAYSFLANSGYASLIKVKDNYGSVDYPKYIKGDTDNYPSDVYGPVNRDGYRALSGTSRIWTGYDGFNYFTVWNRTSDTGSKTKKVIDVNGTKKDWTSSDSMGGKCSGKRETFTYSYKTIDSRVKNISPTSDQVNGVTTDEYSEQGLFWKHYDYLNQNLSLLQDQSQLSFAESFSGLSFLLSGTKTVNTNIGTFVALTSTDPVVLLSGAQHILSLTGQQEYGETFSGVFTALDDSVDMLAGLNFGLVLAYFDRMQEVETLYNKKTVFLSGWSNELKQRLVTIENQYKALPTQYSTIVSLYTTLKNTPFLVSALLTKRGKINDLQTCGTAPNTSKCGCTSNYKQVCDTIDTLILSLNDLSKRLPTLEKTTVVEDIDGEQSTIELEILKSIDEALKDASSEDGFLTDIPEVYSGINAIKTINVRPTPIFTAGLNQTTLDRPIDGPRRISFQGLGGSLVTFVYPNMYDVSVYKQNGSTLELKTIDEIQQSISDYLLAKAKEYNQLLLSQEQKRLSYYSSRSAAFSFLAMSDTLASPNTRSTKYLPDDFFVSLIGKQHIADVAEMLYYQSLPVYTKDNKTYVEDDLSAIRDSFDINKKISYILSGYLTQHPDQGPLVTPAYSSGGYEVAYINSDRADYISSSETPSLIKSIQQNQKAVANAYVEDGLSSNNMFSATKTKCGLDSSYTALLFDINGKDKSPWLTAFKCWMSTLGSSVKFNVSMEVGPSFGDFLSGLKSSFETWKKSFSDITSQQKAPTTTFSGDIGEYWTNVIVATGSDLLGPKIKDISLQVPSLKLLAGAELPITITAKDFSGNLVKSTFDSYVVYVNTGNGEFVGGGTTSPQTPEIFDFDTMMLVYKSPLVSKSTSVTLFLTGANVGTQKSITVVPGTFEISDGNKKIYTNSKVQGSLSFSLTEVDSTYSTLPRIFVSLKTSDGSFLSTPFTVISKNGLVSPGVIASGEFVALNSYVLEKQNQAVFLMPNYRVGEDELQIQIPGLDPISLPIIIKAGSPYRVGITTSNANLHIGDTLTGSVFVTDAWGNPIADPVALKLGSLGSLDLPLKTIQLTNKPYTFSLKAQNIGGISYLYAFLDGVGLAQQSPAYQKVVVQEKFLPEKNLNIMYLNLFGSDWGNNWTQDALNTGYVANLISSSQKLLAVTTQIVEPSRLKKFVGIVSQHGQVRNFSEQEVSLKMFSGTLLASFDGAGSISLANNKDITLFSSNTPLETLQTLVSKNTTALVFAKDSGLVSQDFEITDTSFSYSGITLFDLGKNQWNTGIVISLAKESNQGYSAWNISYQEKRLGTLYFIQDPDQGLDLSRISVASSLFDKAVTFAEGSTNGEQGIGIVDLLGVFEKQGYTSIEDSTSYDQGIGFRSDFKNITLFGDGKTVGEATIPFGSQFLINFGDPLLSRTSKNVEQKSVKLDLGVGEYVYNNPSKSIFKVLQTDFNNDGLTDILTVFTDGSVKLLKNYGGTHPYSNMQDLIRLADSIKDVYVGDVDGNNYPDLLIWTNSQQLRVYKNDKGVLDVDGNLICLNINADGTKINKKPETVDGLQQLFFEDMDKDGKIDIVTNDRIGDVKIFYGGSTNNGQGNYVSTLQYACDANWYARQKNAIKLVKSYGVLVDPDQYVQDESMIHVQGWRISEEQPVSENQVDTLSEQSLAMESGGLSSLNMGSFVSSMMSSSQSMSDQMLSNQLSVAPISYTPTYESDVSLDDIGYKSLLQLSGDSSISVYKKYQDLNGGALLSGDIVKITTTILGLKNNIKATYVDRLTGPWEIPADDTNVITTFKKESGNFDSGDLLWQDTDDVLFVLDNIDLGYHQSLSFSYQVTYLGEPTVSIDVKDILLTDLNRKKDSYPDIAVMPADSCKKYRRVFFNTSSNLHRSYEENFDNIQAKLDAYTNQGQKEGESLLSAALPQTPSSTSSSATDYQNGVNSMMNQIPGVKDLYESWKVSDAFSLSKGNLTFDTKALDTLMAPVSEKLDKMLDSLCQGFKLGAKNGCQPPVPFNKIPFNQAFLAPGDYHIFGCFQQLMLSLSQSLGKGWPVISFPGNRGPTPVGYIPAPDVFGFPFKGPTDGHLGGPKSGTYPSQVRLYLAPTLTLQMGIAICFGPYTVGAKIPKLFRDIGGNCVVAAVPLYACAGGGSGSGEVPSTEEVEPWMTDLAANGSCEQSIQKSSTKVLANTLVVEQPTYPSAFKLSSLGAESSSWTMAVPNGNFGGFGYISFNSKPTKKQTSASYGSLGGDFNFDALQFLKGPTIDLKIKDSNARGIIKILVKDWLGRQVKYIVNNLTKLTVNVTLPDVSQLANGFDSLVSATSWTEASEQAKQDDTSSLSDLKGRDLKQILSKQTFQSATNSVNNPFDSLITMFQTVPLVDLYTKDVVLKIPLPTSEELIKYESYLKGWLKNQQKILKQWLEAIHELASICGSMTPEQAKIDLEDLKREEKYINELQDSTTREKLLSSLTKEKTFLQEVIDRQIITQTSPLIDDSKAVFEDIGKQFGFFARKVVALPRLKWTQTYLGLKSSPTEDEKALLLRVQKRLDSLSTCATFSADLDGFSSFYKQATELVRNVQQNIQVLQQYKQFPLQLYNWMHFVDKYMADIVNFISTLSSSLIGWVGVNAKIYTKWVNALILILSAIKTWQVLIDLSTNWTKKCGKCSRDGYGSYSCSLGFLFPKIPIIPIPPFKIPNINIDLSHVDLGVSIALPRFVFTPVDFPMPQLPNLPSPPDFNLSLGINGSINLKFDLSLPTIPVLPGPPTLPELPSFIPKIDFSLPLLPPAPKIPNLIPKVSSVIEIADFVVKIFCILKKGVGLVGEKGVKAKVEQLTQRTWDVPIFDFFDQTFNWKTDAKPKGFDFQLDGFLQFKMDFSAFYDFLDQIAASLNSFMYNAISAPYSKAVSNITSGLNNNKVTDFLNKDIRDVNLDLSAPSLDIPITPLSKNSELDYQVAYNQLSTSLQELSRRVDDPDTQKSVAQIHAVLNTPIVIQPATKEIEHIQEQVQNIVMKKQKEVRQLANSISSYDRFLAQVKRNDIALVSDDHIQLSFTSPLFTANKETYNLIKSQEHPLKAYMDTNASLVNGYLQTLESSTASDLSMSKTDYQKTTDYLQGMKSTIDSVYDKLGFEKQSYMTCGTPVVASSTSDEEEKPLLAQASSLSSLSSSSSSSSSSTFSSDISSYVRGVFVEDPQSGTMINVVRSQPYVSKIGENYLPTDINQDKQQDLLLWDSNSIYVKYGQQASRYQNAKNDSSFYLYSPGIFSFSSLDSYNELSEKADSDGYVEFGNISVKLLSPSQEVKNFRMVGQSFDAIQLSWTNHSSLGEPADGYLVKLNHRVDTYHDKDSNFRFLDDKFLNKRYILVLPAGTNYSGATIDFKERYYYKGSDGIKARNVVDFLSGGIYSQLILAVKTYQSDQSTISLGLNEIPRNWQYAEVVALKNTNTADNPYYLPQGPWSNQIVAGRQIISDKIGPEATITLERPSIPETVSTGNRHNGFVGTYYNLVARWKDNVAVSRMWIEQNNKIILSLSGSSQTGNIQLSKLYFTGENSSEYIFGAEDFNGNTQLEKVTLDIKIPDVTLKGYVPLSESSGQLVAEMSHDIDEGMVVFQRQRNNVRQELSGTLANAYGGYSVGPKQTIITGSIFSLGNTVGLFDVRGNEIGQISIDGNVSIYPTYQDTYQVMLDLVTGYPLIRVLNKQTESTVFWIQMPALSLSDITLYQKEPFYSVVPLTQTSFGSFYGGSCIQSLDKQCMLYVSPLGQIYIPKTAVTSLVGEYRFDTTTKSVIYVIKDFLGKDLVRITTKTRLMK